MHESGSIESTPVKEIVFVSWSGGKDSYLSLLRARETGLAVYCLLNFIDRSGYSRSHGLPAALLQRQAAALGIPLETEAVTWDTYETGFCAAINRLKEQGVTGGVFGDIDLQEHRDWIEKMCARCGIAFHLPLWGMEQRQVSEELLSRQGRAVLVSVRGDLLEESWLGRVLDEPFLDYCAKKGLSPCGERGEFHTLVVDGPLFREPLQYRSEAVERVERYARLRLAAGSGSAE
ncbi:MAG: diphthine--ammonia ligase [Bacillota bacterium]